jgi:AraC-like DNA-binding protein
LVTGSLGATDVWGAKLSPRGAQLAFGSAAAVAGKVADFTELLGMRGAALAGRLRDASSFEQRCAIFDAHLAWALLSGRERWSPAVAWAFDRLGSDQAARIADLAGEIGWSRKHLHAQFVGHFGQSPKTLARLARFERALRLLEEDSARLAAIAADAGYYDQSQFNREFRSLAGITPSAYLRSRVAGADYGFVDADDR